MHTLTTAICHMVCLFTPDEWLCTYTRPATSKMVDLLTFFSVNKCSKLACWRRESATWLTIIFPGSMEFPNGTTIDRGRCWASSACSESDFSSTLCRICCTPGAATWGIPSPGFPMSPAAVEASDDPGFSSHLRRRSDGWWVSGNPVTTGDGWEAWYMCAVSASSALWSEILKTTNYFKIFHSVINIFGIENDK